MRRWNSYWIAIALAFLFATPTFAQYHFENVSLFPQVYPPQPTVGLAANRPLCSFGSPGQISQYYATDTAALSFCTNTGWVAFAGGGGAVSSVFTRTGAVVAVSGDYTLDQIGNPAAAKTFVMGTNVPLAFTTTGVYTNTQMNEYHESLLNGCSPATEFPASFAGNFATDGLAGCVATPASGAVLQTNGIAGYVNNSSTSINSVGVLGLARCLVAACKIWGENPVAVDNGFAANQIYGSEVDVNVFNASSAGQAIRIAGAWQAQASKSTSGMGNMPAIGIFGPTALVGGPFNWTAGFACGAGTTDNGTGNGDCLDLGPVAASASKPSQAIVFHSTNASNTTVSGYLIQGTDGTGKLDLIYVPIASNNGVFPAMLPQHGSASGMSPLNLLSAGTCTLSGTPGTCSSTFTQAYAAAPVCVGNGTATANPMKVSSSTTAVTVTSSVADTQVVDWFCSPAAN